MIYTCPKGHSVEASEPHLPVCQDCGLVATWGNTKTGEVYTWTPQDVYEESRRNLQAEIDAAFDHQYFSDW